MLKKIKWSIKHISVELMIVNPLSKGMSPKCFKDHIVQMGFGSTMQFITRTFIISMKLLFSLVFSHMVLYISNYYYYYFKKYH